MTGVQTCALPIYESGHQLAVFGRRGSRPFNLEEMQRLYLRNGKLFTVTDSPLGPAAEPPMQKSAEQPPASASGSEVQQDGMQQQRK